MEELRKRPVTAILIAANILAFLYVEVTGGSLDTSHMLDCGACYAPLVLGGEWYRVFSCMFLHFGIEHLLNNMLVLAVLGIRLEPVLGPVRFLIVYLVGGVGGNLFSLWFTMRGSSFAVSAGASGATFALMGAVIIAAIKNEGRVRDLNMRQVLIMAALSLYLGYASKGVDNAAHFGGLACGALLAFLLYHPKFERKTWG